MLKWTDFTRLSRAGAGPAVVAETVCRIAVETNFACPSECAGAYVHNSFDKRGLWVKRANATPEILEHEHGHWNICELYTRCMLARYNSEEVFGKNLSKRVAAIYNELVADYKAMQDTYGRETAHGIILIAQQEWTHRINKKPGIAQFLTPAQ